MEIHSRSVSVKRFPCQPLGYRFFSTIAGCVHCKRCTFVLLLQTRRDFSTKVFASDDDDDDDIGCRRQLWRKIHRNGNGMRTTHKKNSKGNNNNS